MKKPSNIEIYDIFRKGLWPHIREYEYEPISGALEFCHEAAIDELNEDLLPYMLGLENGQRVLSLLERERSGERCLPDYVWRAFREWLTDLAKGLTDQAEYLEHDEFTECKNQLWQELVRLRRRRRKLGDVAKKRCIMARIQQIKDELDPYPLLPLLRADGIGRDSINNIYFDGEEPEDKQKFAEALRDLAGKILDFAGQFQIDDHKDNENAQN